MSRRKPTALKLIAGTDQPCRANPDEPQPVGELGEPPVHFTAEQGVIWRTAIERAAPGMLKPTDSAALELWCMAYYTHRRACESVTKSGLFVKAGPNSNTAVQSPAISIMNKSAALMLRASIELGFTPASRTRVKVARSSKKSSPFGDLKDFEE